MTDRRTSSIHRSELLCNQARNTYELSNLQLFTLKHPYHECFIHKLIYEQFVHYNTKPFTAIMQWQYEGNEYALLCQFNSSWGWHNNARH